MIIREIKQDPKTVLSTFDYFNDYQDTLSWAIDNFPEVVDELKQGYDRYLKDRKKRYIQLPDEAITTTLIKLPRSLNNSFKSQAALEDTTKNELMLKAFNLYLDSLKDK